jgi:hypothetical protein
MPKQYKRRNRNDGRRQLHSIFTDDNLFRSYNGGLDILVVRDCGHMHSLRMFIVSLCLFKNILSRFKGVTTDAVWIGE